MVLPMGILEPEEWTLFTEMVQVETSSIDCDNSYSTLSCTIYFFFRTGTMASYRRDASEGKRVISTVVVYLF